MQKITAGLRLPGGQREIHNKIQCLDREFKSTRERIDFVHSFVDGQNARQTHPSHQASPKMPADISSPDAQPPCLS